MSTRNEEAMPPFERALAEAEWLTKWSGGAVRPRDLMRAFGLSRAMATRDFHTLVRHGWLLMEGERDDGS